MKVTFFGTTTLLFDDGTDQVLFDVHFTRPSLTEYIRGAKACTDTRLCDKLLHIKSLHSKPTLLNNDLGIPIEEPVADMPDLIEKTEVVFFKLAKYCEAHDVNCIIQYPCTTMEI